jgi:hypothetical protein
MASTKLFRGTVKLGLALPEAFANWQTPTSTELNSTLSFDVTCALVESSTKFELGNGSTDNTLTFCSTGGSQTLTFYNPTVVYEFNRSSSATASDQANKAFGLMAFPDVQYFAYLRVGKDQSAVFAAGDVVSLIRVNTDWPAWNASSGKNVTGTSTMLPQGDILWRYTLAS